MCNSPAPFILKNSNKNFIQRQKNVFDQLNTLENTLHKNTVEEMETDEIPVTNKSASRSITKHFRGKDSIFKRPEEPVKRHYMKTIPDFKKNPHKWKKYSLADVKEEDMSEASNTKTALSFLNELKNRSEEQIEEETSGEPKRILFKKKLPHINNVNCDFEAKPCFKSSKLIMPEYRVGQKVVKEKKQKTVKNASNSQLQLDHLYENLDE